MTSPPKPPSLLQRAAPALRAALTRLDAFWGGSISATEPTRPAGDVHAGGWLNPFSGMGFGATDRSAGNFAAPPRLMSRDECSAIYRADGIAARCVDLPVGACLSEGWTLDAPEDAPPDALNEEAWQDWADRLPIGDGEVGLEEALRRWLAWREIYGGSALFMVCGDSPDPSLPLAPSAPLLALRVLSRYDLTPDLPPYARALDGEGVVMWRVQPDGQRIHRSRLLLLGRSSLPPLDRAWAGTEGWDDPLWARLYRALGHHAQGQGSAAQYVDSLSIPVMAVRGLAEAAARGGDDLLSLLGYQGLLRSAYRTLVVDAEGQSLSTVAHSVSGLETLLATFAEQVCAITGIPAVLLYGRPPAGLTSDDAASRRAWSQATAIRQERFLRPALRQIYSRAALDPRAPALPSNWSLSFMPIDKPTDLERADQRAKVGQTLISAIDAGILQPSEVKVRLAGGVPEWSVEPAPAASVSEVPAPPSLSLVP